MTRILIADRLPEEALDAFAKLGLDVVSKPDLQADDLPNAIPGSHLLVVRSTRVTRAAIENADSLQGIIRAGAGTNTIDCEAAAERAIHVANCPGKNAVAVAELTFGLMLSLDRFIPDGVASLRDGQWEKGRFGKGRGLLGRTLGIIGLGRIGREVLARGKAFGMHCAAFDLSLTPELAQELGVVMADSVQSLCAQGDFISIHLPLTEGTKHIIGHHEFAAMKAGTCFVNASRGGVVDDDAMIKAVQGGHIRAASDVYEDEPKGGKGAYEGPFRSLQGFYGTHHIGASTDQAQQAVASEVVRLVSHWKETGEMLNCVNRTVRKPGRGQLFVRHLDRVGVLARVLEVIRGADISVKTMHNTVFDGTGSAVAAITLDHAPSEEGLAALNACSPHVLGIHWMGFSETSP